MSEEMIFPNVTHYSKVDVHVEAGGMNIQHVEHLHQADVLKALGIELEVKRRPRGDGESAHELPECFRTNRARGLFTVAVEEGLLDDDFMPMEGVPVWKLACLADTIGAQICQSSKWKVFGEYWGYEKEYLRCSRKTAKDLLKEKEFSKKVLNRIN